MFLTIIDSWYEIFSFGMFTFLLIFYSILSLQLKDPKKYILRLKLFQIRDELRFLVAEGKLEEKSRLFSHYDILICAMINNTEEWSIYGLVKAIRKFGTEILNDNRSTKEILNLVSKSDPKVQKLIAELYLEIARLFVKQSRLAFLFLYIMSSILNGLKLLGLSFRENNIEDSILIKKRANSLGHQLRYSQ